MKKFNFDPIAKNSGEQFIVRVVNGLVISISVKAIGYLNPQPKYYQPA